MLFPLWQFGIIYILLVCILHYKVCTLVYGVIKKNSLKTLFYEANNFLTFNLISDFAKV